MGLIATTLEPLNAHTRESFVRAGVKEIPLTTKIIDAVLPYYPKECRCIAGFLNHGDQFWKVNNVETTRISKALGATLVFNEASHVHVEFGNLK